MRLVYKKTGVEVMVGDLVRDSLGGEHLVVSFAKPHKPASSGFVTVSNADGGEREVYVGVIDAEWIEREDRELT